MAASDQPAGGHTPAPESFPAQPSPAARDEAPSNAPYNDTVAFDFSSLNRTLRLDSPAELLRAALAEDKAAVSAAGTGSGAPEPATSGTATPGSTAEEAGADATRSDQTLAAGTPAARASRAPKTAAVYHPAHLVAPPPRVQGSQGAGAQGSVRRRRTSVHRRRPRRR